MPRIVAVMCLSDDIFNVCSLFFYLAANVNMSTHAQYDITIGCPVSHEIKEKHCQKLFGSLITDFNKELHIHSPIFSRKIIFDQ
jgi:hypothetical protein